jgi:hypothetical protein
VQEAKLVEDQARGLHSFNGQDMLVKQEELCARVAGVDDEHAAGARKLLMLIVGISNALVDLGMLPIRDIPELLKTTQEVLVVAGLILEHL